MNIRRATPMDVSALYILLDKMHKETVMSVAPINPEKLIGAINTAIHRGVVLLAEVKNKIVGSIGGLASSEWWSDQMHLSDMWFYVLPDSRNSSAAIKLVKSFIKIGNEASMKIKLGHVYSGDFERKDKFFGRLGLVKAGSLYTEVN
jgi:hypothetical protein